mgnify:CR=1 FL=1
MTTSQRLVDAFLAEPVLALVGASRSGDKFGNQILRELRAQGRTVLPLHPAADAIDGVRCYAHYADLPSRPGGTIVCVSPADAVTAVRDAADAGVRRVWLQQGAESPYVANLCLELGIEAVIGSCILMFAAPKGIHRAHRALAGAFGRLPR